MRFFFLKDERFPEGWYSYPIAIWGAEPAIAFSQHLLQVSLKEKKISHFWRDLEGLSILSIQAWLLK